MYTLLVGFPPFWNRKEYLMLRQIMQGKYSFRSPEWDEISDTAKDLVCPICTQKFLFIFMKIAKLLLMVKSILITKSPWLLRSLAKY